MGRSTITAARSPVFHPLFILLVSLIGATLYAIYATLRFSGDKLFNQYYYVVPIAVPFFAFLLDRAEKFYQLAAVQISIDALIVLTAMWRVFGDVPYVSGHALFLTYGLLSSRSRVVQVAAAVVMVEVVYLKYFVWHDWITLAGGIVLGVLAALISRRFRRADVE